jgi:hypothetical protein
VAKFYVHPTIRVHSCQAEVYEILIWILHTYGGSTALSRIYTSRWRECHGIYSILVFLAIVCRYFFFLSSFLLYDFTFIGPITEQDIGRMVLANLTKT